MQRVQVFQIKHRDISRQDWVTFCYFPCIALQPSYWRDTRQPVWSVWSENQDIKGWWESHTRTQLTCAPHRSLTPIICCWVVFFLSFYSILLFIFPAFGMQAKAICVTSFQGISCEMILVHLQHWHSTDPSSLVRSSFLEPFEEIFWVLGCPHAAAPMQWVIEREDWQ